MGTSSVKLRRPLAIEVLHKARSLPPWVAFLLEPAAGHHGSSSSEEISTESRLSIDEGRNHRYIIKVIIAIDVSKRLSQEMTSFVPLFHLLSVAICSCIMHYADTGYGV